MRYPVNPFDYRMLEEKLLEFSHKFRLPDDLTIIELIYRGPTRARLVLL